MNRFCLTKERGKRKDRFSKSALTSIGTTASVAENNLKKNQRNWEQKKRDREKSTYSVFLWSKSLMMTSVRRLNIK